MNATNAKLDECNNEERVEPTEFKQIVRSLRYLYNNIPDMCFAISIISRFMNDPRKSHLTTAKRILRYVKGTLKLGLLFPTASKEGKAKLVGYSYSEWCGDRMDRRSTSCHLFKFNDVAISWCTKKQPVTIISSCEVEYIAGTFAACQAIWLDNVMKELNYEVEKPLKLKIDNRSAINLAKNPIVYGRSKHIETRFHFVREQVTKGMI